MKHACYASLTIFVVSERIGSKRRAEGPQSCSDVACANSDLEGRILLKLPKELRVNVCLSCAAVAWRDTLARLYEPKDSLVVAVSDPGAFLKIIPLPLSAHKLFLKAFMLLRLSLRRDV